MCKFFRSENYAGICAICFAPVAESSEIRFNPKGRVFHRQCVERWPDDYYVKLEKEKKEKVGEHNG